MMVKTAFSRVLIALAALLVLGAVNQAILRKERIRSHGETVYLALAPVDPRSLMQGDYMALRFDLVRQLQSRGKTADPDSRRDDLEALPTWNEVQSELVAPTQEGKLALAPIKLDARRIGSLAASEAESDLKLRYRIRNGTIWLGTNAFFFEEGEAHRYSAARFGEFRVDRTSGEAVLVGLADAELRSL